MGFLGFADLGVLPRFPGEGPSVLRVRGSQIRQVFSGIPGSCLTFPGSSQGFQVQPPGFRGILNGLGRGHPNRKLRKFEIQNPVIQNHVIQKRWLSSGRQPVLSNPKP